MKYYIFICLFFMGGLVIDTFAQPAKTPQTQEVVDSPVAGSIDPLKLLKDENAKLKKQMAEDPFRRLWTWVKDVRKSSIPIFLLYTLSVFSLLWSLTIIVRDFNVFLAQTNSSKHKVLYGYLCVIAFFLAIFLIILWQNNPPSLFVSVLQIALIIYLPVFYFSIYQKETDDLLTSSQKTIVANWISRIDDKREPLSEKLEVFEKRITESTVKTLNQRITIFTSFLTIVGSILGLFALFSFFSIEDTKKEFKEKFTEIDERSEKVLKDTDKRSKDFVEAGNQSLKEIQLQSYTMIGHLTDINQQMQTFQENTQEEIEKTDADLQAILDTKASAFNSRIELEIENFILQRQQQEQTFDLYLQTKINKFDADIKTKINALSNQNVQDLNLLKMEVIDLKREIEQVKALPQNYWIYETDAENWVLLAKHSVYIKFKIVGKEIEGEMHNFLENFQVLYPNLTTMTPQHSQRSIKLKNSRLSDILYEDRKYKITLSNNKKIENKYIVQIKIALCAYISETLSG